jgi:hypothetical protein
VNVGQAMHGRLEHFATYTKMMPDLFISRADAVVNQGSQNQVMQSRNKFFQFSLPFLLVFPSDVWRMPRRQ